MHRIDSVSGVPDEAITKYLDERLGHNVGRDIALQAALLGATAAFGLVLVAHALWYTASVAEYATGLFLLVGVFMFHFTEFIVAAMLRPRETHPDAFMLLHSPQFLLAMGTAVLEFAVECLLVPESWKLSWAAHPFLASIFRLSMTGTTIFSLATAGFYLIRILGMVQAGQNFALHIESKKRDAHVLVDTGIYAVLRHPAYFGWFWRVVFLQLTLANPISLVVHTILTWRFFRARIPYEEGLLESEEFFGSKYKAYKAKTLLGIPFC